MKSNILKTADKRTGKNRLEMLKENTKSEAAKKDSRITKGKYLS